MNLKISANPWADWANRVVIEVPHYIGPDGGETAGGRQRTVRDIALLLMRVGLDVVVVQKARKPFEITDRFGVPVIGLSAPLGAEGGAVFALRAHKIIRSRDAYLTLAQEDSWPFFVKNAKGLHTGVWWDGPFSIVKRTVNKRRTIAYADACRSVVAVDTNFINWLRCQGDNGLRLAAKCVYVPNCADLSLLGPAILRDRPADPLRILFARRYEEKRGGSLLLDALSMLRGQDFPFRLTLAVTLGDNFELLAKRDVQTRGLEGHVQILACDMDSVLRLYSDCDVAVIPTIWSEGTSYACVEAICSGVPVIVTAVGGLGNLVVPGFNGFVIPPTAAALAESIVRLREWPLWSSMHRSALTLRESLSHTRWCARITEWLLA